MRILGLIPARAGSKGIANKNIRPMNGRSLLERAFEVGRESGVLDRIVLSTESNGIADLADSLGLEVPFLRPPDLATDRAPMIAVVSHALSELSEAGYEPDAVCLLQPTAPLRRPRHIQHAAELLGATDDSVCSVVPILPELSPHFVMKIEDDGLLRFFMPDGERYTRRQEVPIAYRRDGTVYLTRVATLRGGSFYGRRCVPMVLRSEESITIDTPPDWEEAVARLASMESR